MKGRHRVRSVLTRELPGDNATWSVSPFSDLIISSNSLSDRVSKSISSIAKKPVLLVIDQFVSSGTNAIGMIFAARILVPRELSVFAFETLIILGFGSLQRSALTSPAMAAQRVMGKARIPLRWVTMSASLMMLMCFVLLLLIGRLIGIDTIQASVLVSVVCFIVCGQDGLRYWAITSERPESALIGDFIWLVLGTSGYLVVMSMSKGSAGALSIMGGSAVAGGMGILLSNRSPGTPSAVFSSVWRLGRWGAVTSTLSTFGALFPLIVAAHVLDPTVVGIYRTLQTAVGPLNVLATSISMGLASTAWKYTGRTGIEALVITVKRLVIRLTAFGLCYLVCGVLGIIWITHLEMRGHTYIPFIIVLAGLLGAPTAPLMSGALVLGRQKYGTIGGVFAVVITVVVTLLSAAGGSGRNLDPVGITTVIVSSFGIIWWIWVFRRAIRTECRAYLEMV